MMDPKTGSEVHYCCVHTKNKKIHSYNCGDHELETVAELCLGNVPPFHSWYLHRTGKRTYGFLMKNGCTYFAMADSSLGNLEIMQFLENLRNASMSTIKDGLQGELASLIPPLIVSCANVTQSTPTERTPEGGPSSSNAGASTKVPLLGGKSTSKREKKKMKERDIETSGKHLDKKVQINVTQETTGEISSPKSQSRGRNLQQARRLWWYHVKVIAIADLMLCLILLGIWLKACNWLDCLSNS